MAYATFKAKLLLNFIILKPALSHRTFCNDENN